MKSAGDSICLRESVRKIIPVPSLPKFLPQPRVLPKFKTGPNPLILSGSLMARTHLAVTEKLVHQVQDWAKQIHPERFWDLYAGVGVFGILAAESVPQVFFVEENPGSLKALEQNIQKESGRNFQVLPGQAEKVFPQAFQEKREARDWVLMDPPRTGLERSLAYFLAKQTGIRALIYISCDLAVLVRDLKILLERGSYQIESIVPFDLFPRTKHIETAVLISRTK